MPDLGFPELILVIIVTLVVVGPKDLPRVIRAIARFVGKVRRVAGEFRSGFDDIVRESELAELKDALERTRAAMEASGQSPDDIDPTGALRRAMEQDQKENPSSDTLGGKSADRGPASGQ